MMAYTSFLLWGFHELCVVQRRQHHHFHDQEPSALGTVTVLGEKVVSALRLSCQLKMLKHDCFFGWPASLLTGRTGVCDVNWGDVN